MSTSQAIVRKPLLTAIIAGGKTVEHVEIKQIEFAPSQRTGTHLHPCPVVGYIASGMVHFQVDGEPSKTLKQGDAFFEPANAKILHFDNASDYEPLTFIAFYLLDNDEQELIRMLE
jgi:quercetin dioxygenase-like cupin family protein